ERRIGASCARTGISAENRMVRQQAWRRFMGDLWSGIECHRPISPGASQREIFAWIHPKGLGFCIQQRRLGPRVGLFYGPWLPFVTKYEPPLEWLRMRLWIM